MSYISSQTGKLHQKKETKRLKNFPARNMWEYFIEIYSRIADDVDVQSEDIQI